MEKTHSDLDFICKINFKSEEIQTASGIFALRNMEIIINEIKKNDVSKCCKRTVKKTVKILC